MTVHDAELYRVPDVPSVRSALTALTEYGVDQNMPDPRWAQCPRFSSGHLPVVPPNFTICMLLGLQHALRSVLWGCHLLDLFVGLGQYHPIFTSVILIATVLCLLQHAYWVKINCILICLFNNYCLEFLQCLYFTRTYTHLHAHRTCRADISSLTD